MESWDVLSIPVEPHYPQILRSDGETRTIAINLPRGEELQEHQVHERAYLLVLGGEIEIAGPSGHARGGPGLLAHFEPNERHTVSALDDARLLLLLSPWPGPGHPSAVDRVAAGMPGG